MADFEKKELDITVSQVKIQVKFFLLNRNICLALFTIMLFLLLTGCGSPTGSPTPAQIQPAFPTTIIKPNPHASVIIPKSTVTPSVVPGSPTPGQTPSPYQISKAILQGHTSPVTRLRWSPEGSLLASSAGSVSSADNTIRLWRADGTLIRALTGHSQPVADLAWSPDGQTLASASLDGTIRFWDREGNPSKVYQTNAGRVFAVAWSPDGSLLASASIVNTENPTVQIWNSQGKVIQTLSTAFSGGKFYNLAWSPDGQYLAGGATDYKIWRRDGSLVKWFDSCAYCTPSWAMRWSSDSQFLAIGNESGSIFIYNNQGDQVAEVQDQGSVTQLAWSPNSQILAGSYTLWSPNGAALNNPLDLPLHINTVDWSPDGSLLAVGGSSPYIHVYTSEAGPIAVLQGQGDEVQTLQWAPDGKTLASAANDGTITLWKFQKP